MSYTHSTIKSNIHSICAKDALTRFGDEDAANDAKSERSTAALLGRPKETVNSKAKSLWKKLKEENAARKTNIQHVTSKEATAITGHGENGPKSNAKKGEGDKRTAATLGFF